MYSFSTENYGSNAFLVQKLDAADALDSTCLGMLSSNEIDGVAKVIFNQVDGDRYLKYNVTSKIPMKQLFGRRINKSQLLSTFIGICDALLIADDYMLPQSSFLIDSEYIYVDVNKKKVMLLCVPLESQDVQPDLKAFFKNELVEANTDPNENGDYVVRILDYIKSAPQISLASFRSFLISLRDNSSSNPGKSTQSPGLTDDHHRNEPHETPLTPKNPVWPDDREKPAGNKPNAGNGRGEIPSAGGPHSGAKNSKEKGQSSDTPTAGDDAKPMSLLYLLQHYSAENLEAYKAQKGKKDSSAEKAKPSDKNKNKSSAGSGLASKLGLSGSKKNKASSGQKTAGFAIPGMDTPPVLPDSPGESKPGKGKSAEKVPYEYKAQPSDNGARVDDDKSQTRPTVKAKEPYSQQQPVVKTTIWNDDDFDAPTEDADRGLMMAAAGIPYLLRLSNQEKVYITKPQFRIGRGSQYPDYNIFDNRAVGHSHAIIVKRDSGYYVMDTNSKNHTFVDGDPTPIPPNTEVKLEHGMKVQFANEAFEFRMS